LPSKWAESSPSDLIFITPAKKKKAPGVKTRGKPEGHLPSVSGIREGNSKTREGAAIKYESRLWSYRNAIPSEPISPTKEGGGEDMRGQKGPLPLT